MINYDRGVGGTGRVNYGLHESRGCDGNLMLFVCHPLPGGVWLSLHVVYVIAVVASFHFMLRHLLQNNNSNC